MNERMLSLIRSQSSELDVILELAMTAAEVHNVGSPTNQASPSSHLNVSNKKRKSISHGNASQQLASI